MNCTCTKTTRDQALCQCDVSYPGYSGYRDKNAVVCRGTVYSVPPISCSGGLVDVMAIFRFRVTILSVCGQFKIRSDQTTLLS